MESIKLVERINSLEKEINEVKRIVIAKAFVSVDKERNEDAWQKLMQDVEETSKLWQGNGAVEEIKEQREK